jgi:hypothetical protein
MSTKTPKKIPNNSGVINQIVFNFRLIVRLMRDRRVSIFLKILPAFSLLYLINPLDIPGPFDDTVVILLFSYMFIELCPPDVVAEHRAALLNVIPGEWKDAKPGDIVEGQFREEDDENKPK